MGRFVDIRLLLTGIGLVLAVFGGLAAWAAIAGAPKPMEGPSITVPLDVIAPDAETPSARQDAVLLPAPKAPGAEAGIKPFDPSDIRPRIAIVITELGLSRQSTEAAIAKLPPEVTLAFLPFTPDTDALAAQARAAGHEILLDVPMEPANYPEDDPGPEALMTNVADAENLKRLGWNLARTAGYAGVVNYMGSRFVTADAKLTPVLSALHDHGLLFVDTHSNPLSSVGGLARELKVPYAAADIILDAAASRDAIDQALTKLEGIARGRGKAVGIAGTYPVTFERLAEWTKSLGAKGIALAPITAVVTAPK